MIYSIFWIFYFIYLLYISITFMFMAERMMRDILQYTGRELLYRRLLNLTITFLFNFGQFKFFLVNGLVLVLLLLNSDTDMPTIIPVGFAVFQTISEYCETFLPLILGMFLIYLIEAIGFVDDDQAS